MSNVDTATHDLVRRAALVRCFRLARARARAVREQTNGNILSQVDDTADDSTHSKGKSSVAGATDSKQAGSDASMASG